MKKGFTTIEITVAIAILIVLAAIPIANFVLMQKRTVLDNGAQEFIGAVRGAQNKTLAAGSQYGVYLDSLAFPNKYILFKGESFALRDVAFDESFPLPDTLEFYNISFGGGNEIVFDRVTGVTQQSGSVSLRVKNDTSQNKTIYISNFGVVSFNEAPTSLDTNRVKDSRHVTFEYQRTDISTENIILTFDGTVVQQIPISTFSTSGELDWRGTVNVGGTDQKIYIHTYHIIDNPYPQFSIFRDRRYNNKSLTIKISPVDVFDLAQYSADGLTVLHPSTFVTNFVLQ